MTSVRVAAHIHSSWSYDAKWSLQDIARAFRRRRYNVVLMSEHDRGFDQQRWVEYQKACMGASAGDILLVPGIEGYSALSFVMSNLSQRRRACIEDGPFSERIWLPHQS
jgi:hypothetical protein